MRRVISYCSVIILLSGMVACKEIQMPPVEPPLPPVQIKLALSGLDLQEGERVSSVELWTDTVFVLKKSETYEFCCPRSHMPETGGITVRVNTDKAMYTCPFDASVMVEGENENDYFLPADMTAARKDCGPFGWGCCSDLETADGYLINGAGAMKQRALKKILKSTGRPMSDEVKHAIENYDIIVFDGSNGKFMFDRCIEISNVSDKTIYGINNAVCETIFYLTPEIQAMFDENNIMSIPLTEGEMLTLPNGKQTNRYRHYLTRLLLMQYMDDQTEFYLRAGFIRFNTCENIILRNITFIGGGAYSLLDNYSNITLRQGTKHVWVDHCTIQDGCDGNFDMGGASDFVTVTWCKFAYGPRSYASFISNLAGNDENLPSEEDHFNTTYAFCEWPETPDAERIPHARYGRMHVFNCYYPTNKEYAQGIQGGYHSRFLVENNYFEYSNHFFRDSGKTYGYILRGNRTPGDGQNTSYNPDEISIPYEYEAMPAEKVKALVTSPQGAGPTLQLHKWSY